MSGINWSDHSAEAAIIEQGHAFTESEVTVSFTAKLPEDKKTVSYGIGVDDDVIEGTAASIPLMKSLVSVIFGTLLTLLKVELLFLTSI